MKNPYIYKWVRSLRSSCHLNHIDKRGAVKEVLKELHGNRLVAILIDQWASADGLWVNFFGKPTSTTSIPVRFAKHTGAALVPAYCIRVGADQYEIQVKEEVPIQEGDDSEIKTTEQLNRILEQQILKYPEQWSWAHRRWKGYEHYQKLKSSRKTPAKK
jgi:KDO2-lipid IV(A) lauroyltransferase